MQSYMEMLASALSCDAEDLIILVRSRIELGDVIIELNENAEEICLKNIVQTALEMKLREAFFRVTDYDNDFWIEDGYSRTGEYYIEMYIRDTVSQYYEKMFTQKLDEIEKYMGMAFKVKEKKGTEVYVYEDR